MLSMPHDSPGTLFSHDRHLGEIQRVATCNQLSPCTQWADVVVTTGGKYQSWIGTCVLNGLKLVDQLLWQTEKHSATMVKSREVTALKQPQVTVALAVLRRRAKQ